MSVVLESPSCTSVQSVESISAEDSHTTCVAISFLLWGDWTQTECRRCRLHYESETDAPRLIAYRVTNDHISRWFASCGEPQCGLDAPLVDSSHLLSCRVVTWTDCRTCSSLLAVRSLHCSPAPSPRAVTLDLTQGPLLREPLKSQVLFDQLLNGNLSEAIQQAQLVLHMLATGKKKTTVHLGASWKRSLLMWNFIPL